MKKNIYFDNAATTAVDPRVLEAMLPYFNQEYGNASSLHSAGLDNRVAVDRAQAKIADFLGCNKSDVYFTSGATESDNMAILGVSEAIWAKTQKKGHIITTKIEHDAILEPCQELVKRGWEVTYLSPNNDGLVSVDDLKQAIRPETMLVSIMYVNNEIGSILPIAEFGQLLAEINQSRENKIYFHTDATQALNYCDCDVDSLGVDLLSLSGHKIYGPKGVGVLYLKKGTPFKPLFFGGHQQNNIRPGTYNVSGIIGLGRAVEILADETERQEENQRLKNIRDYLIEQVQKNISRVTVTGGMEQRIPANASFVFEGVEGESVLLMLSEKDIAISTGSACSSGSLEPSHVLLAIGVRPEVAHGSLRVSLGRSNQREEVDVFVEVLIPIIEKLRAMSPLK